MSYFVGFEIKVRINSTPYAVRRASIEGAAADLSVANSEGKPGNPARSGDVAVGYEASVPGLRKATISLTSATFDDDANPFAAPLSITEGDYVSLDIYPGGLSNPPYVFPSAMVTKVRLEAEIDGLQPITLELVNDGEWTNPA